MDTLLSHHAGHMMSHGFEATLRRDPFSLIYRLTIEELNILQSSLSWDKEAWENSGVISQNIHSYTRAF